MLVRRITLTVLINEEENLLKFVLKLYISGDTQRNVRAITNLRTILDKHLSNKYTLEIIDIIEKPSVAEIDKILVTPTLIKKSPLPVRRIIGDFSNEYKVLFGLDYVMKAKSSSEDTTDAK